MQGVERYKVSLLPHDDRWKEEFLEIKDRIQKLWDGNLLDIQHFGSTAIKGIYAKPILDIAIVVKTFKNMDIDIMKLAGYDYCGPQNEERDRYLFVLRGEKELSLQHLHCYEPENGDYRRCIGFRDYLNNHPDEAFAYSELKQKLAKKFPDDRFAYADGKRDFIESIYGKLI